MCLKHIADILHVHCCVRLTVAVWQSDSSHTLIFLHLQLTEGPTTHKIHTVTTKTCNTTVDVCFVSPHVTNNKSQELKTQQTWSTSVTNRIIIHFSSGSFLLKLLLPVTLSSTCRLNFAVSHLNCHISFLLQLWTTSCNKNTENTLFTLWEQTHTLY